MKDITYKFADGTTSVIEVSEEFYTIFQKILDEESAINRKKPCDCLPLWKLSARKLEIADIHKAIEKEYRCLQKEKLQKAMENLTEKQQELIVLVFYEQKTQKEIAEMKGMKPVAITCWLNRVLEKLKTIYEQMEN